MIFKNIPNDFDGCKGPATKVVTEETDHVSDVIAAFIDFLHGCGFKEDWIYEALSEWVLEQREMREDKECKQS